MRYGLASVFAAISLLFGLTVARAQQPSPASAPSAQSRAPVQLQRVPTSCPPGVPGPCWKVQDSQGNTVLLQGQGSGGFGGIAHSPPLVVAIPSCTQDSDCAGSARCSSSKGGICERTSIWCNADADCKYSEVCDTSQPALQSAGKCVPRGGHY